MNQFLWSGRPGEGWYWSREWRAAFCSPWRQGTCRVLLPLFLLFGIDQGIAAEQSDPHRTSASSLSSQAVSGTAPVPVAAPSPVQEPKLTTAERLNRASDRVQRGDSDGALEDYASVIASDSQCLEAYYGQAGIYSAQDEQNSAMDVLTRAIKARPSAKAYLLRANVF